MASLLLVSITGGGRAAGRQAVENRRRVAYDADMAWAMMSGFVALAALIAGLYRDTGRRIDDLRTENREA